MERRVVGGEGAPRGGGVRRLRVVDEADAADLGDELEPVRDPGERLEGLRDRARPAMPSARAAAVAAAAFSRLCAPGISGSAGSSSAGSNSTRRARPGTSSKPRGTTATSASLWFSKIRSFASR